MRPATRASAPGHFLEHNQQRILTIPPRPRSRLRECVLLTLESPVRPTSVHVDHDVKLRGNYLRRLAGGHQKRSRNVQGCQRQVKEGSEPLTRTSHILHPVRGICASRALTRNHEAGAGLPLSRRERGQGGEGSNREAVRQGGREAELWTPACAGVAIFGRNHSVSAGVPPLRLPERGTGGEVRAARFLSPPSAQTLPVLAAGP